MANAMTGNATGEAIHANTVITWRGPVGEHQLGAEQRRRRRLMPAKTSDGDRQPGRGSRGRSDQQHHAARDEDRRVRSAAPDARWSQAPITGECTVATDGLDASRVRRLPRCVLEVEIDSGPSRPSQYTRPPRQRSGATRSSPWKTVEVRACRLLSTRVARRMSSPAATPAAAAGLPGRTVVDSVHLLAASTPGSVGGRATRRAAGRRPRRASRAPTVAPSARRRQVRADDEDLQQQCGRRRGDDERRELPAVRAPQRCPVAGIVSFERNATTSANGASSSRRCSMPSGRTCEGSGTAGAGRMDARRDDLAVVGRHQIAPCGSAAQ